MCTVLHNALADRHIYIHIYIYIYIYTNIAESRIERDYWPRFARYAHAARQLMQYIEIHYVCTKEMKPGWVSACIWKTYNTIFIILCDMPCLSICLPNIDGKPACRGGVGKDV